MSDASTVQQDAVRGGAAPTRGGASARLADRLRDPAGLAPSFALSGALWALVAALLALLALAQLAFGWTAPAPFLGLGRLDAAQRQALLLGATSLPLAGGLLAAAGLGRVPSAGPRAFWALAIWNLGLAGGLVAILAGGMQPDAWASLPAPAAGLIWIGALLWLSALWSCASGEPGLGLPAAAGLMAGLGLLLHLGLGSLLSASLEGWPQSLAAASIMRGLPDLWLVPAALGLAAALLPPALGLPLYGRRLALLGLWAWLATSALALPRDLLPELLPTWMERPVALASVLRLAPAIALTALLLGSRVGPPAPAAEAPADGGDGQPWWRRLVLGAALLLALGMLLESALLPASQRILQFTTWSPAWAILPPPGSAWPLALAASWALLGGDPARRPRLRPLVLCGLGASLLGLLPLAPLALAESTGIAGAAGEMLRLEAALRLPGHLCLGLTGLLLALEAWRALRDAGGSAPGPWTRSAPAPASPAVWLASSGALLAGLLFVTSLLPLSDPALAETGPRGAARVIEAGSLRADGRAVYVREGCVVCHSQRVRGAGDSAFGPALGPSDYAGGPALVGHRRAGPDLAWTGQRYDDIQLLSERLSAHAAGGAPAYPWLFEPAGPLPEGRALIEYLDGLRVRPAAGARP